MIAWLLPDLYVFIAVALATATFGVIQARRGRESRLFLHVVVQLYWVLWGGAAYLHGLPTSPFWVIFPLVAIYSLLGLQAG